MTKAYHLANSAEWATPLDIIAAATTVLGSIDLDPASTFELNRDRVHATKFFDAEADGLSQNWSPRVFLNPPGGCRVVVEVEHVATTAFSGGDITRLTREVCRNSRQDGKTPSCSCKLVSKFWNKLIQQHLAGIMCSAIWIGFSVEQLQTSQNFDGLDGLTPLDFSLCFPKRRVQYVPADDYAAKSSPPHASYIAYLGPRRRHFAQVFSEFGKVIG